MSARKVCSATVTSRQSGRAGQPCQRWAVKGSEFCAVHGGTIKLGLADAGSLNNRCTATSTRTHERCKNPAIAGGTVCKSHGGGAPQTQKKAKERLMELVEPAITQLNRVLTAPGTSDGDRLRAVQMVLDRTGYGKSMTVEHEVKPWEIMMEHVFSPGAVVEISRTPPPELEAEIVIPETDATFVDPDDDSPRAEVTRIHPAYDPGTPDSTRPR